MLRSTSTKLALTGLIAAAAVALLPSAALAASPRCEAKEGDTVARNTTTRVFMRTTGTVDDGQDVRIYSCRLGTRTAVLTTRFRNDLDGELRLQEAILGSSKYLGLQAVVTRNGGLAVLDAGVVTVFDAAGTRIVGPSGASALGWGIGTNTVYWTAGPTPFSTTLNGRPSES